MHFERRKNFSRKKCVCVYSELLPETHLNFIWPYQSGIWSLFEHKYIKKLLGSFSKSSAILNAIGLREYDINRGSYMSAHFY